MIVDLTDRQFVLFFFRILRRMVNQNFFSFFIIVGLTITTLNFQKKWQFQCWKMVGKSAFSVELMCTLTILLFPHRPGYRIINSLFPGPIAYLEAQFLAQVL